MNLHNDRDAFKVLLSAVSERVNIREDILEKDYQRREEEVRIGSDLSSRPFSEFAVLEGIARDREIEPEYQKMQHMYVFNDDNTVPFLDVVASMQDLRRCLLNLDEKTRTVDHITNCRNKGTLDLKCPETGKRSGTDLDHQELQRNGLTCPVNTASSSPDNQKQCRPSY